MRPIVLSAGIFALAACATTGEPELTGDSPTDGPTPAATGDVRVGGGYRGADDPCRRAGATALTEPFISTETDLVACPVDFDGRPAFIQSTSAREATRTPEWVIYNVPLFGAAPVGEVPVVPPATGGGAG
ncbi:MAG: hypothetical protein AAGP08_01010 [Pseudomonadota bacterium]